MMEADVDFLSKWAGWLVGALGALLAIVSIRGKFDVNQWLNDRREWRKRAHQQACPHAWIIDHEGEPGVKLAFISPQGTSQYQCQRCGLRGYYDADMLNALASQWANNLEAFMKADQEAKRLAKKL